MSTCSFENCRSLVLSAIPTDSGQQTRSVTRVECDTSSFHGDSVFSPVQHSWPSGGHEPSSAKCPARHLQLPKSANAQLTPQSKADAEQHVRKFTAPAAPQAPELPADLASDMSAFDAQSPTIGASKASAKADKAADSEEGMSADAYLKFLEQPLPKPEKHH